MESAPCGTKKAVWAVSYRSRQRVIHETNAIPDKREGGDQRPINETAIGMAAQNSQILRRPTGDRVRSDKKPIIGSVTPSHNLATARMVPMIAGAMSNISVANFMK